MLENTPKTFLGRFSFTQKLGGLAAFFLVLLGSLSGYSLLDSYEIRREIEEMTYSDMPLFRTAIEIKQRNQEFINTLDLIQNYRTRNTEIQAEKIIAYLHRLDKLCMEIDALSEEGTQQAKYALEEERIKEGTFRLNQSFEDYEKISALFYRFQSSHQLLHFSLDQLSRGVHQDGSLHNSSHNGIFQDLRRETLKTDETVEKIFSHLDLQMQSSLKVAMHEQQKLQLFNLTLALTALISGTICAIILIGQLKNSIVPVTRKAKKIAQALSQNNDEGIQEGLNAEEIAKAVMAGKEIAELGLAFNQMVDNLARSHQAQLKSERLLAEEKNLMAFTLSSISDGVITTVPDGKILTANVAAGKLLGYSVESLIDQDLITLLTQNATVPFDVFNQKLACDRQRITIETPDGREKVLDISHAPICSETDEVLGYVIVLRDLTQMVDTNRKLTWQSSHDFLTGLANRREFLAALERLHEEGTVVSTDHTVLYLDLDRFKIVNDTCGHDAGDELLIQISHYISNEVRKGDLVARLGGDEFGIILENCPLSRAIAVAEKILLAIQKFRFFWLEKKFSLGISIGVVAFRPNQDDPVMILKAADQACYQAKNTGRNQVYAVPDTERHLAAQNAEMNWLTIINRALSEDHFQLFQQKIVAINDTTGQHHKHYEILLRLKTSDGKILPPGAFLPIAERYELMAKIDRWVISHFFESQSDYLRSLWRTSQSGDSSGRSFYSLNLSSESLNDPQLISFLEQQFALHQIPPEIICFEITETMAIANLHRASQIIRSIKNLGCRFALDDFGSGMSSFGYLQTLPVDFLKIDGQFIRELCQNSMNAIIVEALQQVAKAVKIKTIAEFVEDEETLQKLRELDVDYAQGYGIHRPSPLRHMEIIKSQNSMTQNILKQSFSKS
ncbi:diguanylate cyclase/phosphodiesterase with PAS/PAC sensor(s) [[Leptolyngbya] sp. PCC 7376]|uniref:EAL domain-containing protein n=1 Tax=[Leptolyngbya] sp. PCC 7376 TaxID=111781 RepID=UPI00029EEF29|nr:EAL domain-containing protein [[Leptolyngbya] sp. PCC 7376]AFY39702.1 diguanylate cyclase/phosphodiesterase with PAS/PAC sensor(s) [[Leptolyngbya] sp. PCC 7376]